MALARWIAQFHHLYNHESLATYSINAYGCCITQPHTLYSPSKCVLTTNSKVPLEKQGQTYEREANDFLVSLNHVYIQTSHSHSPSPTFPHGEIQLAAGCAPFFIRASFVRSTYHALGARGVHVVKWCVCWRSGPISWLEPNFFLVTLQNNGQSLWNDQPQLVSGETSVSKQLFQSQGV